MINAAFWRELARLLNGWHVTKDRQHLGSPACLEAAYMSLTVPVTTFMGEITVISMD